MRLFWKVFAVLWLATLLVGGSGFLISRALQQDWLLLQFHPQLRDFSQQLVGVYEQQGADAAQTWLEQQHQQHRLRSELFDSHGQRLLLGPLSTLPQRPTNTDRCAEQRPRRGRLFHLGWAAQTDAVLLLRHLSRPVLFRWPRTPLALFTYVTMARLLLALVSLPLSR